MSGVIPRVLAILGPTASGKSALALEVAARVPVEILSCDSQQVYVGMDIGTGKPGPSIRQAVPHHLLDLVLPSEAFDAARWAALARGAIGHIVRRGRLPLVVGGTGLYFRALLGGLFEAPPPEPAIRQRHREEAALRGVEALHARLASVDPATAARVQPRDLVRISRALEVYEQTGVPISVLRRRPTVAPALEVALLILDPPLDLLRERIARRFDEMMDAGLLEETRGLRRTFGSDARGLGALGYRQLGDHLDGLISLPEAVAAAKAATVAYARRQRTWFRGEAKEGRARRGVSVWRAETTPDAAAVVRFWNGTQVAPSDPGDAVELSETSPLE